MLFAIMYPKLIEITNSKVIYILNVFITASVERIRVSCYIGTTRYYLYSTTSTVSAPLWKFQTPSTLGWQPVYFVPVLFWQGKERMPPKVIHYGDKN